MVLSVTRQTTHVFSVVTTALPCKGMLILRVALQAITVDLTRRHFRRTNDVLFQSALDVLLAVGVAGFARGGFIALHELCTLVVNVRAKALEEDFVASFTTFPGLFRPNRSGC